MYSVSCSVALLCNVLDALDLISDWFLVFDYYFSDSELVNLFSY